MPDDIDDPGRGYLRRNDDRVRDLGQLEVHIAVDGRGTRANIRALLSTVSVPLAAEKLARLVQFVESEALTGLRRLHMLAEAEDVHETDELLGELDRHGNLAADDSMRSLDGPIRLPTQAIDALIDGSRSRRVRVGGLLRRVQAVPQLTPAVRPAAQWRERARKTIVGNRVLVGSPCEPWPLAAYAEA